MTNPTGDATATFCESLGQSECELLAIRALEHIRDFTADPADPRTAAEQLSAFAHTEATVYLEKIGVRRQAIREAR